MTHVLSTTSKIHHIKNTPMSQNEMWNPKWISQIVE